MASDLFEKKESRQCIIFNEKYKFKWDGICWHLIQTHTTQSGKLAEKCTYHASLSQIANAIIEREAGICMTMEELRDLFTNAVGPLTKHLEGIV